MSTALVLALPSKGRLQDNAGAFFSRAGLPIVQGRGARDYRGSIDGVEGVEVAFLSASEIAGELARGTVHLGVTGFDLMSEECQDVDRRVYAVTPLGFGHANVVVAVPAGWIDVRSMDDLDDVAAAIRTRHGRRLRVATKYVNLTRAFFGRHRVADYRIVESLGATEGAVASGAAEAIVDITSTGATLAANGLRVLEDGLILRSEANLFAALSADWGEGQRAAARALLDRIAAEESAQRTREVRFRATDAAVLDGARDRLRFELPFGSVGETATVHVAAQDVFAFVAYLRTAGVGTITVHRAEAVFERDNLLLAGLLERIGPPKSG